MNGETRGEDSGFKVECSWCGRVIRRTSVKDSHGMCLRCYARMLSDHGHSGHAGDTLRWARGRASER